MKRNILFFIILNITHTSWSMEEEKPFFKERYPIFFIKDKNQETHEPISASYWDKLKKLSRLFTDKNITSQPQRLIKVIPKIGSEEPGAIKAVPKPPKLDAYIVSSGLDADSLEFLLQLLQVVALNIHGTFEGPNSQIKKAIQNGQLHVDLVTRDQLAGLELDPVIKSIFDNLVVIKTNDGKLLNVPITDLSHFTTLENFFESYQQPLVLEGISGEITQADLMKLYTLAISNPKSYEDMQRDKITLSNIIRAIIKSKEDTLKLLEAANYLGAKAAMLQALYNKYKTYFTDEQWKAEVDAHPFLEHITFFVASKEFEFASISDLVQANAKDFYIISGHIIKIFGPQVSSLKGIASIPGINNCTWVRIENTNISMINETDLPLPIVTDIKIKNNKNLTKLGQNCFNNKDLPRLTVLEFVHNNIKEIDNYVFNLDDLDTLVFLYNGLQKFNKHWWNTTDKFNRLILCEPELITFDVSTLSNILQKINLCQDTLAALVNAIQNSSAVKDGAVTLKMMDAEQLKKWLNPE